MEIKTLPDCPLHSSFIVSNTVDFTTDDLCEQTIVAIGLVAATEVKE